MIGGFRSDLSITRKTRGHMHSFAMNIFPSDVVSKDILRSFRNLLRNGDGTSAKKLVEDLDIFWVSKGGNVDLSKWSKDDFSTDLIPARNRDKLRPDGPLGSNADFTYLDSR